MVEDFLDVLSTTHRKEVPAAMEDLVDQKKLGKEVMTGKVFLQKMVGSSTSQMSMVVSKEETAMKKGVSP